jgi:drug/metabolite transporter (DMT)-like permease
MQARPLDAFAATLVFALCVVWGFNQVVVKLALPDVGPIAQTGVRSGVGALCVIAYALSTRRRIFAIDGTEAAGALAGALFTAEFIALYESLRFTTAARNRRRLPRPKGIFCNAAGAPSKEGADEAIVQKHDHQ